jgi:hypothetical protein
MSKFLSSVARQEFDTQVKHAYQNAGKLRMCVTNRTGVNGDIYKFRRMGKGLANQKASQADVTPMDITHNLISCILENWNAPEYTDIFDQAEVNFDEQSELASVIANAMGRRQDQLIIDALGNISADAGTALSDIVVGATGFTVDKVRQAGAAFDGVGMGGDGRYIAWNKTQKQQLLGSTEATSSDFMNVKALVNGDIDTFYGFRFVLVEDRVEGGLPGGGSASATSFAFHRDAVGLATGIDIKSEINYIAQKTSWLCNGVMKAGSAVRDAEGVVKILSDDTL